MIDRLGIDYAYLDGREFVESWDGGRATGIATGFLWRSQAVALA